MATNYRTVSLLYVGNYVFKNLLNNVLIVHLKKCVYGNKLTYQRRAKKWLVGFNFGKTQLVLFDRFHKSSVIDVKMDGSVLEEKTVF